MHQMLRNFTGLIEKMYGSLMSCGMKRMGVIDFNSS